MSRFGWRHVFKFGVILAVIAGSAWGIAAEIRTSRLQALILSRFAQDFEFSVGAGASPSIYFPTAGPYNERLGYARLPSFIQSLTAGGFVIDRQAQLSPQLSSFITRGGFPVFHEKTQAGLRLLDRSGATLFHESYPGRVYPSFETVPSLVTDTLLFIENRELLDPRHPNRNPAVEWDRLATVIVDFVRQIGNPGLNIAGGSTLATQIEKYRHSPEGQTLNAEGKLRQMVSASLRAYLDGPDTTTVRRRIVTDYLNSTPLTARAGFGEVHGLGDGLWAWYGADFETVNRLLRAPAPAGLALTGSEIERRALAYKQVLSLLLAQRRPSFYLLSDGAALRRLTDTYLRLLAHAGIIDQGLRDAALAAELRFRQDRPTPAPVSFVERKAANAIRSRLLPMLGLPSLYQLDRLDLTVSTTLDDPVQEAVTGVLRQLRDRAYAETLGLTGPRLLDKGDPARVIYSVTLMERGPNANYVRLQADNLDRPLDINEGAKLDLGSTAKLRTLVTYLEIAATLHGRYGHLGREELAAVESDSSDPLTLWAVRHLSAAKDKSLAALLDAAMARRYSASPAERFFTGGGVHRFGNFDSADDGRVMSVAEAFRNSVNLVFIRMMRDIVAFHIAEGTDGAGALLADPEHPARRHYLERFADREGSDFLNRFYKDYRGRSPDEALNLLASRIRPKLERFAVIFRSVRPDADLDTFAAFLRERMPGADIDPATVGRLYEKHAPGRFNLADRGYLARVHPLELWLAAYLQTHPGASRSEMLAASDAERQAAYAWLFKTRRKSVQDTRVRTLLEEDAFVRIHRAWQRLGYPFDSLVPSYATAIGSSADRPAALGELMGIILNDGLRLPTIRIERLDFAVGTPYETALKRKLGKAERVLAPEVAATVRRALRDVAENGTARRIDGAFVGEDGAVIPIGGKTGTGDHRHVRYGAGRQLIESRVVNRTATFVFFIGERFFGTITAHVPGPEAAEYRFTSGLPAQLLKALAPTLQPLLATQAPTAVPTL
ncbi:transglycosylase domain-containing protein [Rhodospirillaceae bacterium SYSU D60014]|uniref:transglycosylase domain-containing protein n=1 Tax=Virgifigura deserti TaxID=2268457 RepID=UPI000E66EC0E